MNVHFLFHFLASRSLQVLWLTIVHSPHATSLSPLCTWTLPEAHSRNHHTMDETALAAELLAEKFSHGPTQPAQHLSPLPDTLHPQLQADALPPAQAQTQAEAPVATSVGYAPGASIYPQATNSNAAAVTNGESTSEPVQAYAKLEGDSFCYYIR